MTGDHPIHLHKGSAGINKLNRQARGPFGRSRKKGIRGSGQHNSADIVYIGPSVEGSDEEYVKVLSGEVDRGKPSFA
ncbi:hypothetical protein [Paenibacillus thiaminolyticus]|uniref:Uncharacterized protein n=1 Tax=Paenibacillus thiaminolyticus TaxID=49283 RepID=A0A3A3GAU1_PANTH|nr:hypothetical protein [Paenibacillus thiaminolyticus]RJG15565.1 hypothetical protein DQX05_29640 [Paenibacillus thiaminolyticus]